MKEKDATGAWQSLYEEFLSMNDDAWDRVDRRLARERTPEEVEEIQRDFVDFTRFVWSNFVRLELDFDDPVIERILKERGSGSLATLGVKEDNLNALRPDPGP